MRLHNETARRISDTNESDDVCCARFVKETARLPYARASQLSIGHAVDIHFEPFRAKIRTMNPATNLPCDVRSYGITLPDIPMDQNAAVAPQLVADHTR